MKHSKTTIKGKQERLDVLRRHEPHVSSFMDDVLSKTLRKDVKADDVLDATVAFVTAEAKRGKLSSLVGEPSHDSMGLPMEMLYLSI